MSTPQKAKKVPADQLPSLRRVATAPGRTVTIKRDQMQALVSRLEQPSTALGSSQGNGPLSIEARHNTVLGCKTSEVALTVLAQVVQVTHPNFDGQTSEEDVDQALTTATAILAELEPKTAMEALVASQMVATHRLAMTFFHRAMLNNQTTEGIDSNVLRGSRVVRLFNELVEAMAKLKGTAGQQKVTVEHVTVQSGGQAVVGVLERRGGVGGFNGESQQGPCEQRPHTETRCQVIKEKGQ